MYGLQIKHLLSVWNLTYFYHNFYNQIFNCITVIIFGKSTLQNKNYFNFFIDTYQKLDCNCIFWKFTDVDFAIVSQADLDIMFLLTHSIGKWDTENGSFVLGWHCPEQQGDHLAELRVVCRDIQYYPCIMHTRHRQDPDWQMGPLSACLFMLLCF